MGAPLSAGAVQLTSSALVGSLDDRGYRRRVGGVRRRHVGHVDREGQGIRVAAPVVHGDGEVVVDAPDLKIQRLPGPQLATGRVQGEGGSVGPAKSVCKRVVFRVRRHDGGADVRARRRVLDHGANSRITLVEYGRRVVVQYGHICGAPAHRHLARLPAGDRRLAQGYLEAFQVLVLFVVKDVYLDVMPSSVRPQW